MTRYIDADAFDENFDNLPEYWMDIVDAQPTVTAIPLSFIADKLNSLYHLQKKMSAWTTPELEIQIKTLENLIYDYAQIANTEERKEE